MRYVAMPLAVAGLAVVVLAQERPIPQRQVEPSSAGVDRVINSATSALSATADAAADPFGDLPDLFGAAAPTPDPASPPLSGEQAAALRQAILAVGDAGNLLARAAEFLEQGGNAEAAGRMAKLSEAAKAEAGQIAQSLEKREAALADGIARAEAEVQRFQAEVERLRAELARTREGKAGEPTPDPISTIRSRQSK